MAYKLVNADQLDADLTAVADSIRAKTGGTDPLTFPDGMKEAVDSIEQGDGGLDMFEYIQAPPTFSLDVKEVTEDIVLHLERAAGVNGMFDLREINAPKVTVYISNLCTNLFRFMRKGGAVSEGLRVVEIVGDTSGIAQWSAAFFSRSTIERIECDFDFSNAEQIGDMLGSCKALQTFRIVPNTLSLSFSVKDSPDLTDETLRSIVDGYKDMTGQTSPVLSLHADVKEKLTDTQKATLTGKNVTIA